MKSQRNKPVSSNHQEEHPLITFALAAFNQEQFIREAVEGAFSQTYAPLEIIISDDCSTDRTFEIIEEMTSKYSGPNKILINRNENNLGIGAHVNKLFDLSSGKLVVLAAGDDISLPERTNYIYRAWSGNNYPNAVFTGWNRIDSKGAKDSKANRPQYLDGKCFALEQGNEALILAYLNGKMFGRHGATAAYSSSLHRGFRPLNSNVMLEDIALHLRALLLGEVLILSASLILYRSHENRVSALKGSRAEHNRIWSIRNGPSMDNFCDDLLLAEDKNLVKFKRKKKLLRVAKSWSKCAPLMEQWFEVGFLKRLFVFFPYVFFVGSRRHKKFALRNLVAN